MKYHLSVDWMVTELWVTGKVDFSRISATIHSPFSRLNGRHISVIFQSAYFLKNKITPNAAPTRVDYSMRKYANHSATGTVSYIEKYLEFV